MMKKLFATLCLAAAPLVAVVPATAAGATTNSTCPGGRYPSSVAGRPATVKVGMTGMAVWADKHGWHLRVSEAGKDRAVFTGRVTTDGTIKALTRYTERGDLTLDHGRHRVVYRFTNYGGVDGLDFVLPCSSSVRFSVAMNGRLLSTNHIVVGGGADHPAANPFTISKA
jgi:hypothetical protein